MAQIRPTGRFWRLDEDGFIVDDAAPDKISTIYQGLLAEVRDAYLERLGDLVHSIYLRGMVARGMAVGGVSDLDAFAFLYRDSIEPNSSWNTGITGHLLARYPFVTGVDLEYLALDELGDGSRFFELGLLMVTQTACMWGENIAPGLPRYRPGNPGGKQRPLPDPGRRRGGFGRNRDEFRAS